MSTDKKTIAWYNKNAKEYAAHVRNSNESIYHAYYEKPAMYALIPNIKKKSVLSLGCGSGEDSSYLKKRGAKKSVGIDISSELIKIAIKNHSECHFELMDMEHLRFKNASFDFVYSSLAIHYNENWTKVFKEVYRILKQKSYFLFSCSHPLKYTVKNSETETNLINKLKLSKNKKSKEIILVENYLERIKIIDGLGKNSVNTWHKPFGEISSELASAGFLIEKIVEPKPLKKLQNLFPETYNKLAKIPEFVIFKLLKK